MKKNLVLILLVLSYVSCDNSKKITLSKLEGSPPFLNAKISTASITLGDDNKHTFSFNISDYELGAQTTNTVENRLANSSKGQHIHFIVNNGPYSAHYINNFKKKLNDDNNIILAFLSRSYHESVKNPNAFVLTQLGENKIDLNNEFLFYSRPKGTYKGKDTEKLLLDFYLINTKISPEGNKVKATINDTEFIITEWAPYYLQGLPKGEVKIKLELLNAKGELVDSPFNPSIRTVNLE
ncbi:MAG: hypothetical protein ACJ0PP_04600 [Flavobacteriaceae bacterium]|tara:strand:+ start:12132 stop:12845 length:714 start_codon:yes stop_codon:yes gene_type:complete